MPVPYRTLLYGTYYSWINVTSIVSYRTSMIPSRKLHKYVERGLMHPLIHQDGVPFRVCIRAEVLPVCFPVRSRQLTISHYKITSLHFSCPPSPLFLFSRKGKHLPNVNCFSPAVVLEMNYQYNSAGLLLLVPPFCSFVWQNAREPSQDHCLCVFCDIFHFFRSKNSRTSMLKNFQGTACVPAGPFDKC